MSFGDWFPARRFRWFGGSRLDRGLYYEFLPTGPASVLHFVLTEIDNDPDATAKVPWSLTVYAHSAKWDPKARTWAHIGPKPWQVVETIDVGFVGPFRVMGRGADYYFLIDGGSLFRAPPADTKGGRRRMERVYDGRERPVLATVTDADAGRTFLFVEAPTGPAFFELSDSPTLTRYDPKAVPMPDGDEPLRSQMHKARVLATLGKIKGK